MSKLYIRIVLLSVVNRIRFIDFYIGIGTIHFQVDEKFRQLLRSETEIEREASGLGIGLRVWRRYEIHADRSNYSIIYATSACSRIFSKDKSQHLSE